MSYLNRLWSGSGGVVVVNDHHSHQTDGFKSFGGNKRLFKGYVDSSPLVGMTEAVGGATEEKRLQAEDSLRQVMYFNCWGQN